MDTADLRTRHALLTGALTTTLEVTWPRVRFTLDSEAAEGRPGEPIDIGWCEGPTVDQVATALLPRWRTHTGHTGHTGVSGAAPGQTAGSPAQQANGYPVRLRRSISAVGHAAALLALHDAGSLRPAVDAGPSALADVIDRWLASRPCAGAEDHRPQGRVELLAEIVRTHQPHGDPYAWAQWLLTEGSPVLSRVLPNTLSDVTRGFLIPS